MNKHLRQYLIDVGPPTLAYFAAVAVSAFFVRAIEPGPMRLLVAALPLPALVWMAHAELRRLRRRDELRQRIELETMTIAFAVSFGLVATLAFLELHGALDVPVHVAAVLMAASWVGAQVWVRARYRYWWLQSEKEDRT